MKKLNSYQRPRSGSTGAEKTNREIHREHKMKSGQRSCSSSGPEVSA